MLGTKLDGTEAIEAFRAAQGEGEAIRVWSYSPNGGYGGPAGETDWGSDEWVERLIAGTEGGLRPDSDDLEYEFDADARTLEISDTPARGVHQYYTLSYAARPDNGLAHFASNGAHGGFNWDWDFPRESQSDALQTLLTWGQSSTEDLSAFGIGMCEDFTDGDDGDIFLIADPAIFAATVAKCREFSGLYDDDFEFEGDDVAAYLRHGIAPEWMREEEGGVA